MVKAKSEANGGKAGYVGLGKVDNGGANNYWYKYSVSHAATDSASVVSPNIYSLIATSPRLRRMLLPEGILASPYEVLDYDATLTLGDTKGIKADFQRTETVRFLQSGVAGILDHVWGDGVALTYYHNEAGNLEDSFNDQGRRHLVIGFKRAMRRGESDEV